jgi:hypothetical protein
VSDLTQQERALAELIGTAVGEDLRKAVPLIRARVAAIRRLTGMPGIETNAGDIMANTYIDMVIRTIEDMRP